MARVSSAAAAQAIMIFEPVYQGVISRRIRVVSDDTLTHLQIQALYLMRDVGPLAMHQISSRLRMSKQHLTRFVDALVKKGLLERFQKENNRRTVYIRITEDGLKALDEYILYATDVITDMMEKLDDEDRSKLVAAAEEMESVLSKLVGVF